MSASSLQSEGSVVWDPGSFPKEVERAPIQHLLDLMDFGTGGDGITSPVEASRILERVRWVRSTILRELETHDQMKWMPGLLEAIGALHIFERTLKLMQEGKVCRA